MKTVKFVDLFCGIGGFRLGAEMAMQSIGVKSECVLSSDIDPFCQEAYEANFGEKPVGDLFEVKSDDVPDHDLLLAGFPCQPFSIIGNSLGFDDTRGTLFFEIARILATKRPAAFVLENVKRLERHDRGRTLDRILKVLTGLGYTVDYKVFNALDFGLPQKRERIWIVGFLGPVIFDWPKGGVPMKSLEYILEKNVPKKYYASDRIREKRHAAHKSKHNLGIWHENKAGNVSSYPYSCALRAGASYNYLLVNGERRLTPREMLRLQGYPDSYKIVCNDSQARKQAGNSLPVPVAEQVISMLMPPLLRKLDDVSDTSVVMERGESVTWNQDCERSLKRSRHTR